MSLIDYIPIKDLRNIVYDYSDNLRQNFDTDEIEKDTMIYDYYRRDLIYLPEHFCSYDTKVTFMYRDKSYKQNVMSTDRQSDNYIINMAIRNQSNEDGYTFVADVKDLIKLRKHNHAIFYEIKYVPDE